MKYAQVSIYNMDIDRYLDRHVYNKLVGITKCCGNIEGGGKSISWDYKERLRDSI